MKASSTLSNQRILITGGSGLLGNAIVEAVPESCETTTTYNTAPVSSSTASCRQVNLSNIDEIEQLLQQVDPETIVHCAAITDVDYCEANPDTAFTVNTDATEVLAEHAEQSDSDFVFISTDAVYGGETSFSVEHNSLNPVNVYTETKVEAERRVRNAHASPLIVRTNLHGISPGDKTSLSEWMYQSLSANEPISLFEDAYFSPLYAPDLAELILEAVDDSATGSYNFAASERMSKLEFGQLLADVFGLPSELISASRQAEFGFDAPRPNDTSLCVDKARDELELTFPTVRAGLRRMASDLEQESE